MCMHGRTTTPDSRVSLLVFAFLEGSKAQTLQIIPLEVNKRGRVGSRRLREGRSILQSQGLMKIEENKFSSPQYFYSSWMSSTTFSSSQHCEAEAAAEGLSP